MKLSDFTGKQWRVLLILMLVNFVNYVDRQIVFALFPYLRQDFGLTRLQRHSSNGLHSCAVAGQLPPGDAGGPDFTAGRDQCRDPVLERRNFL